MATAQWATDTSGTYDRLIAYYNTSSEPPRTVRWNAVYGNIKQPYMMTGAVPSTYECHIPTGRYVDIERVLKSSAWQINRGFRQSVDPATDATRSITDLVKSPEFTHDLFSGFIDGATYPIEYRVETTIYDENTADPVYIGLDSTRRALFANYFYPQPVVVGGDGTSNGDVLAESGHLAGGDWCRLLSSLVATPNYYQTRGVVIDRGSGPERASYARGPASRNLFSVGACVPKIAPQSIFVGPPSGAYQRKGSYSGTNPLHFGLPSTCHIKWNMTQGVSDPAPEWRAKLLLWGPTTPYGSPTEISLGSGTMTLDGSTYLSWYYYQDDFDLAGIDVSGKVVFQVLAESKPGYSSSWSIANSYPYHKAPCGWPLWAISARPDFEVPFIPAPLFRRSV